MMRAARSTVVTAIAVVLTVTMGGSQAPAPAPGLVLGWGANGSGQLGDGSRTQRLTAVSTSLSAASTVAAGDAHSLALTADGSIRTWGRNTNGQLGLGDRVDRVIPTAVASISGGIVTIAAGSHHSLAIGADGGILAWGSNSHGQLGDGTTSDRLVPVQVPTLEGAIAIAGGQAHSLALTSDGSVWAWGMNNVGQLGDGTAISRPAPAQVTDPVDPTGFLTGVVAIAAGGAHSMALKGDGSLRAWGRNESAQVGSSADLNVLTPIVPNVLADVIAIAAGYEHSLALTSNGMVWAWGGDSYGQLGEREAVPPSGEGSGTGERAPGIPPDSGPGTGERPPSAPPGSTSVPVQVKGLGAVAAISTHGAHSLARMADGTVWAWGLNASGELGDGTTENRSAPVRVAGVLNAGSIAAGWNHNLVVVEEPANLTLRHVVSRSRPALHVPVTFTIHVTNNGPATATGVVVSHTLASGFDRLSVSTPRGSCDDNEPMTCAVATLPAGGTVDIAVSAVPTVEGLLTSSASVSALEPDHDPLDNRADALVLVLANAPPAADAGGDQVVSQRQTVTLDGSRSSDPNQGDTLSYLWEQVGGTEIDLYGAATTVASFTAADRVETLRFRLTVTDRAGQSRTDEMRVTVLEDALNAVYVSATSGSDSFERRGGPNDPFRTLQHAFAAAASRFPRPDVYVQAGDYVIRQTLHVQPGVSVYGGFEAMPVCIGFAGGQCVFTGLFWSRTASNATRISGPTFDNQGEPGEVALDASNIFTPTVVDGLTIESSDGQNANNTSLRSDSSIAIYVRSSSGALRISNNKIVAGRGAPGRSPQSAARGEDGRPGGGGGEGYDDDGSPRDEWQPLNGGMSFGIPDWDFCTGGPGSYESVRGTQGGTGGWGNLPYLWLRDGQDGYSHFGTVGQKLGGAGGSWHSDNDGGRSNGKTGATGTSATRAGTGGTGGLATGEMRALFGGRLQWFGMPGEPGTHGRDGEGGTGGGGGGGQNGAFVIEGTGAGGGSGGNGGCGGSRGEAGGAGGGSFGIVLAFSSAVVTGNDITTRGGGAGGDAGRGVPGGRGGPGGAGGTGSDEVGYGGAGGPGGDGSGGGGGGGGAGGSSCGILLHSSASAVILGNIFGAPDPSTFPHVGRQIGAGGRGGDAGQGGTGANGSRPDLNGAAGAPGERGRRFNICPPPATAVAFTPLKITPGATEVGVIPVATIGSAIGSAAFGSRWRGSDVRLTLISPEGRRIGRDINDPLVHHVLGPDFESYIILNPTSGDWGYELFGLDVPSSGEPVTLSLTTETLNRLPVATAGPAQVLECAGVAGTPATLSAAASTDEDGDPLTFRWLNADGQEISAESMVDLTLPHGVHRFTLVAMDGRGGASSAETTVTIVDTVAPGLTLTAREAYSVVLPAASAPGAVLDLSQAAAASDVCDPSPRVTNDAPATFLPGRTVVTFMARDASGNTSNITVPVAVTYVFSGFGPPMRHKAVFKSGSSIPVNFRLAAADGSMVSSAQATLDVARLVNAAAGRTQTVATGLPFHFDPDEGSYRHVLKTRSFVAGSYVLTVTLNDGTSYKESIVLK